MANATAVRSGRLTRARYMQPASLPAEAVPLLDALIEVIGNAEWIVQHHTWLREAFKETGFGSIPPRMPEEFVYGDLPPKDANLNERSQLLVERVGKARASLGGHTLAAWVQHRDQLSWSIVDFLGSVHAAREALPTVVPFVDSPSVPQLERWSSRVRRMLGEIGGVLSGGWNVLPPIDDAELSGKLTAHFSRITDFIQDLKALGPSMSTHASNHTHPPSDEQRLAAVREQIRAIIIQSPSLKEEMERAFIGYMALVDRRAQAKHKRWEDERVLARALLATGRLIDPEVRAGARECYVVFDELCPSKLSKRLDSAGHPHEYPERLEREAAAAALKGLDRSTTYYAASRTPKGEKMAAEWVAKTTSGTHVKYTWRVVIARPVEWQDLDEPADLSRKALLRLSASDRRMVTLYRLGGLADTGSVFPVIERPNETADIVASMPGYLAWSQRLATDRKQHDAETPVLDPEMFPPDLAEEMLGQLKGWAEEHRARLLAPTASHGKGSTIEVDGPVDLANLENYRPGRWYGKELSARLRMASRPGRKGMVVRRIMVGKTVLYLMADVKRWWPEDFEKALQRANKRK